MFSTKTRNILVVIFLATSNLVQSFPASIGNECHPQDDKALIKRFEHLLKSGNLAKLGKAIRDLESAELGDRSHELIFLKALSALHNGNNTSAKSFLVEYLKSNDNVYKSDARDLLQTLVNRESTQFTNSIGMQLIRIPKGSFYMGSKSNYSAVQITFDEVASNDPSRFSDEHPQHLVKITNNFFAGKFEVTIGQFQQFVAETGYQTDAMRNGGTMDGFDPNSAQKIPSAKWVNANWRQGRKNDPVSYVSWNDANAFASWLGKKENKRYRLPTEAEWEYFARAGTTTYFSSGDSQNSLAGFGNVPDLTYKANRTQIGYDVVPTHDGYAGKAPVGQFKPNRFGLHDTHGNVFEWCYDGYAPNGYQYHKKTNPYIKPDTKMRVIRGGCYM